MMYTKHSLYQLILVLNLLLLAPSLMAQDVTTATVKVEEAKAEVKPEPKPTPKPTPKVEKKSSKDDGSVWVATREWNEEEEKKFSEWLSTTLDENFFVRHKIPTDCADVPYGLRFIYARNNSLPQGAHDLWGNEFGNWSKKYSELPRAEHWTQDQRFLAALLHVTLEFTLVRSLPYDTYPIALSPEAGQLRPGTVISNDHHAAIIYNIAPADFFPIKLAYSTLPPTIRPLVLVNYEDEFNYQKEEQGLANWNWWRYDQEKKKYVVVPDEEMPGYSREQYDLPRYSMSMMLHRAYSTIDDDPDKALDEMISSLKSALKMRSEVVHQGYIAYRGVKNRSKGSVMYDNYSTPGRDERILGKFKAMHDFIKRGLFDKNTLLDRLRSEEIKPLDVPPMNLLEFRYAMINGMVSPEPWDHPHERWGILDARLNWYRQMPRDTYRLEWTDDGNIVTFAGGRPSGYVTPDGKAIDMPKAVYSVLSDERSARADARKTYGLGPGPDSPGDMGYDPDPLVLEDKTAIVVRSTGKLSRMDEKRQHLWSGELPGHTYVPATLLDEDTVLITSDHAVLYALNLSDGSAKWSASLAGSVFRRPVITPDKTIYVSAGDTLHAFNADGKQIWHREFPSSLYAQPAIGPKGKLYLGCLDKRLYCVKPDGEIDWSFPTLTAVLNKAIIDAKTGRIYALTMGNELYCLSEK